MENNNIKFNKKSNKDKLNFRQIQIYHIIYEN